MSSLDESCGPEPSLAAVEGAKRDASLGGSSRAGLLLTLLSSRYSLHQLMPRTLRALAPATRPPTRAPLAIRPSSGGGPRLFKALPGGRRRLITRSPSHAVSICFLL